MDGWYNQHSQDQDDQDSNSEVGDRQARQRSRAVWLDRPLEQRGEAAESEGKDGSEDEDEEGPVSLPPPAQLAALHAAFVRFLRVSMLQAGFRRWRPSAELT